MSRGLSMDIRKNDIVQVIAGRSRGPRAYADACSKWSRRSRRVYVEHVNMVKRHVRPNPAKQIRGGILEKEGPSTFRTWRWCAAIADPPASSTGKGGWRKGAHLREVRESSG